MVGSDKRKQSLYFPAEMLKEIQEEATRQDRSLSWIVQKAWKVARREIMKYPSTNEFQGGEGALVHNSKRGLNLAEARLMVMRPSDWQASPTPPSC